MFQLKTVGVCNDFCQTFSKTLYDWPKNRYRQKYWITRPPNVPKTLRFSTPISLSDSSISFLQDEPIKPYTVWAFEVSLLFIWEDNPSPLMFCSDLVEAMASMHSLETKNLCWYLALDVVAGENIFLNETFGYEDKQVCFDRVNRRLSPKRHLHSQMTISVIILLFSSDL